MKDRLDAATIQMLIQSKSYVTIYLRDGDKKRMKIQLQDPAAIVAKDFFGRNNLIYKDEITRISY